MSEAELEGLRHMLLPCFQARQQGRKAHDVPGLSVRCLGGLVGKQLHTCLCQEAWEEKKAMVSVAHWGRRGERAGIQSMEKSGKLPGPKTSGRGWEEAGLVSIVTSCNGSSGGRTGDFPLC